MATWQTSLWRTFRTFCGGLGEAIWEDKVLSIVFDGYILDLRIWGFRVPDLLGTFSIILTTVHASLTSTDSLLCAGTARQCPARPSW